VISNRCVSDGAFVQFVVIAVDDTWHSDIFVNLDAKSYEKAV